MSRFDRLTLDSLEDVEESTALVRVDYNVPLDDGEVLDDTRIRASLETLNELLEAGCSLVLMSHLGRPGGSHDEELSLEPVAERLQELLGTSVGMARDVVGNSATRLTQAIEPGEVVLLENLRFHSGEKQNDDEFARSLAGFGHFYVNDAFGACHRAHASIAGVPRYCEPALAGRLVEREVRELSRVRDNPNRPLACLMGGAKLGDKLPVVEHFLDQADEVLVGGAMAYTFAVAEGGSVGDSLVDEDFIDDARRILDNREQYQANLTLPDDTVITPTANPGSEVEECDANDIPDGWEGMDIGPRTREHFREVVEDVNMVFWNGPLGVFEMEQFAGGTRALIETLADIDAEVIVGGGDSASAVAREDRTEDFRHVSTGGGASLRLVSGGDLPGLEALDPIS